MYSTGKLHGYLLDLPIPEYYFKEQNECFVWQISVTKPSMGASGGVMVSCKPSRVSSSLLGCLVYCVTSKQKAL